MAIKQRLQQQLSTIRGISDMLLSVFETPQQWTHQVHDQANHALWFIGHMGMVDDFFIRGLDPQKSSVPPDYPAKFGMGSRPTSDPADYPAVDQVRAFMRERRETLLGILAALEEEDLLKPAPEGYPPFMTDVAAMFETAVWHEALHAGQVTVARRSLGHPPMVDAAPDG